jgi:hypothetical protein
MRWRCLAVPVSRDGYRALRCFARYWAHLRFAIEGQPGWVRHLTTRRRADRSNAGVSEQNPGAWRMGISVRKVGDELNLYKLGSCHDHAPTHRSMATLHKRRSVARVLSFGVVCRILSDLGTWCGHGAPNGDAIALGGPRSLRSVALGVGAAGLVASQERCKSGLDVGSPSLHL